MKWF